MNDLGRSYRLSSDAEPEDELLAALMHEVAVDAEVKSTAAKRALRERTRLQISDALVREGYSPQ